MTKFSDAEITQILPPYLADRADVRALSKTLQWVMQDVLDRIEEARTWCNIDGAREDVLDLMAAELGTQYYSQDLDIEKKRELVKNTLPWYAKAGTVAAVEEMAQVVFGEGKVTEWPDFTDGEKTPYFFDIETNARMTEDAYQRMDEVLGNVKNLRSELRRILIKRQASGTEYAAAAARSSHHAKATNVSDTEGSTSMTEYTAGAARSSYHAKATNEVSGSGTASMTEYAAAAARSSPKAVATNVSDTKGSTSMTEYTAGAARSSYHAKATNEVSGSGTAGGKLYAAGAAIGIPRVKAY